MPKRHTLQRRTDNRIIDELRQLILAGIPWRPPNIGESARGYGDLIYLVKGHYYPAACDFVRDQDDRETLLLIWAELRQDIIEQHIQREPGTRPWSFWHLEDREPRGDESECDYLERLHLLRKKERELIVPD
jgi:hypothetical protein